MSKGLRQQAYDFIKGKIISCEYHPNSFLNEAFLQEEIGASRTPIREALGQLEQENLVKIMPKKGIIVTDVSINDINVIYEARILIEPFIIRNYASQMDYDKLIELRKSFMESDISGNESLFQYDDDLHMWICRSCSNVFLVRTLKQTYVQNSRLRVLTGNANQRLDQSINEHLLIIDKLLIRDFEAAAQAMVEHLEKSRKAAFDRLVQNGGWLLK